MSRPRKRAKTDHRPSFALSQTPSSTFRASLEPLLHSISDKHKLWQSELGQLSSIVHRNANQHRVAGKGYWGHTKEVYRLARLLDEKLASLGDRSVGPAKLAVLH